MSLAHDFFKYWCETLDERAQEVSSEWGSCKGYTNLVIHSESSIIIDIAKRLNLHCYNGDYYYIDSVLYDEADYIKDFPSQCYLTDIRIAFEHENNFKSGLYQEVSHLLLINSDLKVVVSYPPSEQAENDELEYLHKIISSSRPASNLAENDGFLFIMGHENPYSWKGWLYKHEQWHQIANSH